MKTHPYTATPLTVSYLTYLSSLYPPTITVRELSEITREREQTIRNKISSRSYPIPSFTLGRKRVFRLIDVANYLEQCFQNGIAQSLPRRKPGRPTKLEQLAKHKATTVADQLQVGKPTRT